MLTELWKFINFYFQYIVKIKTIFISQHQSSIKTDVNQYPSMNPKYRSFILVNGNTNKVNPNQDIIKLLHQQKYKSAVSKLSGSICVDNLFKKQRNSGPFNQSLFFSQTKNNFQFEKIPFKKEIQPHKAKSSNSLTQKFQMYSNANEKKKEQNMKKHMPRSFLIPKFNRLIINRKPFQGFIYENTQKQKILDGFTSAQVCVFAPLNPVQLKVQTKKLDRIPQKAASMSNKYPQIKMKTRKSQNTLKSQTSQSVHQKKNIPFSEKFDNERYKNNQLLTQGYLNQCDFDLSIEKNKSFIEKNIAIKANRTHVKIITRKTQKPANSFYNINQFDFTQDSITFFQPERLEIRSNQISDKIDVKSFTCQHLNVFSINNSGTIQIQNTLQKSNDQKVEVASITKVMTCVLALKIAQRFDIDLKQQKVFTSQRASKMHGTSAQLQYSESGTLFDFLHGLMLPSGNDAAIAIAEWGGKTIRKFCNLAQKYKKNTKSINQRQKLSTSYIPTQKKRTNVRLFIYHMNKGCKALSLQNTYFANPHGLINHRSYSTAYDICQLAHIAMKNQTFQSIVAREKYSCKLFNRTYSKTRQVSWKNTNKLIGVPGFQGIKTGITSAAGPCLVSQFRIGKKQQIIICVLKAKSMLMRFGDTINILKSIIQCKISEVDQNQQFQGKNTKLNNYRRILSRLDKVSEKDLSFQEQDEHANDYNQDDESQSSDEGNKNGK